MERNIKKTDSPQVSLEGSLDPDFSIFLKATDPLQITITRSSIQLIKDLAEVGGARYCTVGVVTLLL